MIFSKAKLSRSAFGRDHNWELGSNGYRAHELVWSLFSDHEDRTRDFLFHWEMDDDLPVLYTVSQRPPKDKNGYFARIQSRDYDPSLEAGDHLSFLLRANPVVKRRNEEGRQVVHDVVMDAKSRQAESNARSQAQLVQEECARWLVGNEDFSRARRAGFRTDPASLSVERYERHQFKKPSTGRSIVIVTADLRGVLEVTDPDAFRRALFNGLGPSKAFGCGLMLVRRL